MGYRPNESVTDATDPRALLRVYRRAARELAAIGRRIKPRSRRAPARLPKAMRPTCGARCRDGHPCQARAVWLAGESAPRNGRCRLHGGLSTGPKTPEGKARALEVLALAREALAASRRAEAAQQAYEDARRRETPKKGGRR